MNGKHAGRIETRELAELRENLISGPKKVRINSAIQHVGKHGVLYARGHNAR